MRAYHIVIPSIVLALLILLFIESSTSQSPQQKYHVMINEVMYHPKRNCSEWIELYNPHNVSVDISRWILSDDPDPMSPGREGSYIFPNGSTIKRRSFVLIAYNGLDFFREYGIYPDFEIKNSTPLSKDMIEISGGFKLSDVGDDIHLFDSNGREIDKMWYGRGGDIGSNFSANYTDRGFTLSRFRYSGKPSYDFQEGIPTPKRKNIKILEPDVMISDSPRYLPKIERGRNYSMVFLIRVKIKNLSNKTCWSMKVYVGKNSSDRYPPTQIWNGDRWIFSYHYAYKGCGNWIGWIPLRFYRNYKGYGEVKDSDRANIFVKCKIGGNIFKDHREVCLLDIDNSTSGGYMGGPLIGRIKYDDKILLVKDENGSIISIFVSKKNEMEDNLPNITGLYKTYAPCGEDLTIEDIDGNIVEDHLHAKHGSYNFNCWMDDKEIWIQNTGDFSESIVVEELKEDIFLYNGEIFVLKYLPDLKRLSIHIKEDPSLKKILNLDLENNKDLSIEWIKIEGSDNNSLKSGRVYRIKSKIRNIGRSEIKNVSVCLYLDDKCLDSVFYKSMGYNSKYPSFRIDTSSLYGEHRIIIDVRFNERKISRYIYINVTDCKNNKSLLLLTEVFPFGFSWFMGEFIRISNPNSYPIDISGWYLTDQPDKRVDKQEKLIFPNGTIIGPKTDVVITSNSSAYISTFGKIPDFEYGSDLPKVKDVITNGDIEMNNIRGMIALKNRCNFTIDLVVYGYRFIDTDGWNGIGLTSLKRGEYFSRKRGMDGYIDTNTSNDWMIKRFGVGDITISKFSGKMKIKAMVSPDCSLKEIIDEIENANLSIEINSYLFSNRYISNSLKDAIRRGVDVTILLEGTPVNGIKGVDVLNDLKKAGAKIYLMKSRDGYRRYRYTHAKYIIIDNSTLVIGSGNFDCNGFPKDGNTGNREWVVIIKNRSISTFFYQIFRDDTSMPDIYNFNTSLGEKYYKCDRSVYHPHFNTLITDSNATIVPVLSPINSKNVVTDMIRKAKHTIYLEEMIFHPFDIKDISREIIEASSRGVDVKILLNSRYVDLRDVEAIREYGMDVKMVDPDDLNLKDIHTKGIIVDNRSVLVSSINLDYSSIYMNREAGLLIEDKNISIYFAKAFLYDWNGIKTKRGDYKNILMMIFIFSITFLIIFRGRRGRYRWN